MADHDDGDLGTRVLVLAPTARDAAVTLALLGDAGIGGTACAGMPALVAEVTRGAGAVLLTEEAITADGVGDLLAVLDAVPSWSELPVVMLMRGGVQSPASTRVLHSLKNVTLLERPAAMRSVVSAVATAVRGRLRQYQNRDQIEAVRRAEARARALQERFELAVNASELGTFHCAMPLGRIEWNARCKELFWLPPDAEVDFDLFYAILHPDDRARTRRAVETCVADGVPYAIEYRTVSPQGRVRWVRATGRTFYDESGVPTRFDGTAQDVTERRSIEEQRDALLERERVARLDAEHASRMKDEFLATLSHELRTPLNAIFGWVQLVGRSLDEPETVAEGIAVIERNVRLQTQLIGDLLDMSRIISGKVRLDVTGVNVCAAASAALDSVRPAADAKHVRLVRAFDAPGCVVSGDPARLQQVLWNLLSNAVKFTPEGGRVEVRVGAVDGHAEVSVTDTGDGIDAAFLPHVFERFRQSDGTSTRQHGGLGLGLSIVKNLVEMHGGTATARSAGPGLGATFVIRLPLGATPTPLPPPTRANGQAGPTASALRTSGGPGPDGMDDAGGGDGGGMPRLEGFRILIVDDDPDGRNLVRRLLDDRGAVTATAESADDAERVRPLFNPDLILSDIGMPGRDGYDLIRALRDNGVATPAVALTAFARDEDRRRALLAGYQAHLSKPVEVADLLGVVSAYMPKPAAATMPETSA